MYGTVHLSVVFGVFFVLIVIAERIPRRLICCGNDSGSLLLWTLQRQVVSALVFKTCVQTIDLTPVAFVELRVAPKGEQRASDVRLLVSRMLGAMVAHGVSIPQVFLT